MRIWLKYIIGIALGLAFALFFPAGSKNAREVLDFITDVIIHCGRYTLVPLLFFSIATACYKLREDKLILKTGIWTFLVIIVSSLFLVTVGLASALLIKIPRIPMSIERVNEIPTLDIKELIMALFPYSSFQSLLSDSYLLPCFIFAGLLGAAANDDKIGSKPAITVFTSLSHIAYIVMGFFTEILSMGMIAISCRWAINFIIAKQTSLYMPLFILLTGIFLFVALIIYPLCIRFICAENHPYRVIFASIAPILAAFFSGDTNMTLPLAMRHGKESLGIRHRMNAVTYPLFSIFSRGGAALITCVCFIVIFRSYSLLEIKPSAILWIGLFSFLFSFALGKHSTGGAFLLLTILCIKFGGGYEAGYLLLRDAAPVLCSFAAAFDVLTAMAGSYIIATKTDCVIRVDLKKFI